MKIYFDVGNNDDYGFEQGAEQLDQLLKSRSVPHEFHIYPGPPRRAVRDAPLPRGHRVSVEGDWEMRKCHADPAATLAALFPPG